MILKKPVSTEKSLRTIETENKLVFIVDKSATKQEIKKELETLFEAKVKSINTLITPDVKKRAIVQFEKGTPAVDIATKLGLM